MYSRVRVVFLDYLIPTFLNYLLQNNPYSLVWMTWLFFFNSLSVMLGTTFRWRRQHSGTGGSHFWSMRESRLTPSQDTRKCSLMTRVDHTKAPLTSLLNHSLAQDGIGTRPFAHKFSFHVTPSVLYHNIFCSFFVM